ncbi:MAG TPA: ATP-binding protein, partial [Puia sp.]|nr:ATP-binding protein [Puia sp.]
FISIGMAVLMAIFAYLTYSRENKGRRVADRRASDYQHELQDRIEDLAKANKELVQMRSTEKFAATGRIARTIAHEVRNPLTNINLAVEQLQYEVDGHVAQSSELLLGMIHRNSDRINLLITDLLNSTKFADLRYQEIPLDQLLDETLELARDRIKLNNVTVVRSYDSAGCVLSVDVKRMKIALLNIIVNALEAMEPGKGILQIKTGSANHKCFVIIKDNGAGIDEEALSKVFEPYFTSKPMGTGLGLTSTQNIILNHNGAISLESARGMGATVTIQLESV